MAHLYYGADARPAEIPDHVLAHVKVVAATKLRRGESFMLTWRQGEDGPDGRTSVWIQPSIPLRFVFDSAEPETLDQEYLRALANEATSSRGIVLEWDEERADAPPVRAVAA
ncbi:hypothetical protein R8Z57_00995 [Microbacterium sp. M3]|uniref:DUF7882 domain-containing protein n=1 Tax=Microbacterium arthrosphaerae TaxID=792652 RepID=A0ABU4GWG4_9MICO|nr:MULTISPECIES: hypothetical protein [Microbacterium]MDW4571350.1 hypothetical protein [Microbacterium arthrosphaerae]MDW7605205.1 hypothetical protein [Microbacterium sp. M3]